jgi:PKD repeat protein
VREDIRPPVASFTFTAPPACGKTYNFNDLSENVVLAYEWNFGDGQTSALKNPTHTFAAAGRYEVTLKTRNNFGESTTSQLLTIIDGPSAALCRPGTNDRFSDIGIRRVRFNTIDHSTPTGDGYQDYSCTQQTTVQAGQTYTLQVLTSSNFTENVRAWIDYNNDGLFSENELVLSARGRITTTPHQAQVTIPAGAVQHTQLRLRIMSDEGNRPIPAPCSPLEYGQCEDYSISVDGVLSAAMPTPEKLISVYPNPSKGIVRLECNSLQEAQVTITNMLGKTIYSYTTAPGQKSVKEYNFSNAAKGMYLVTVTSAKQHYTQKLILE